MHIFILLLNELSIARPQDTQPLGACTNGFELGTKRLEIRGSWPKALQMQGFLHGFWPKDFQIHGVWADVLGFN